MATLRSRTRSTSARTTGSDSPASGGSRSEARLFAGGLRGASSRRAHRAWCAASRASDPPTATAARSRSTRRTEPLHSDKQPCWRTYFSPRAGARVLTARTFVERSAVRRSAAVGGRPGDAPTCPVVYRPLRRDLPSAHRRCELSAGELLVATRMQEPGGHTARRGAVRSTLGPTPWPPAARRSIGVRASVRIGAIPGTLFRTRVAGCACPAPARKPRDSRDNARYRIRCCRFLVGVRLAGTRPTG